MTIRCPDKACNTKMSVTQATIQSPMAKVKCPSCKKFFKPYDLLPEAEKHRLQQQSSKNEETDISSNHKGADKEKTSLHQPVGWLVVHDEKTHTQTYDLFEGLQVIGKKSVSRPCDVMIETPDPYMSRNHFTLNIKKHGTRYSYLLKDYNSTNHTYVETRVLDEFVKEMRRLKTGEELFVEDGSIIQAGDTKIILKTLKSVNNKSQATEIVSNQDITKTVIL